MDTSETYIKMCEKAEEIQKEWFSHNATTRDFIWCPTHKKCWTIYAYGYLCEELTPCTTKGIWLPRQDQLQEIVGDWRYCLSELCDTMEFGGYPWSLLNELLSFEQFWLVFVMNKKYGQNWNGENWINL